MSDVPDPPRKFYSLKPREFEAVNSPPARSAEAPSPDVPSAPLAPLNAQQLAQLATPKGKLLSPSAAPAAENEVHAILRENLAKANAAGLNDLAPKPRRKSRRKRDYWLTLVAGNLFFVLMTLWRPHVIIFAGAGVIMLTLGLTWVMWFVMDDY